MTPELERIEALRAAHAEIVEGEAPRYARAMTELVDSLAAAAGVMAAGLKAARRRWELRPTALRPENEASILRREQAAAERARCAERRRCLGIAKAYADAAGPDEAHRKPAEAIAREISAPNDPAVATFDLAAHLERQLNFSARTFGPGRRCAGVTAHIAKELDEVRKADADLRHAGMDPRRWDLARTALLGEWADVIILALDGALRAVSSPQDVIDAIVAKQTKNEARDWPDWRTQPADGPIEHIRTDDEKTAA